MTQSEQLFEKSEHFLPGGVNSPVRAFRNVGGTPVFVKSGKGSHILDEDGNDYIDYVCSYGPGILGHAYPAVIEAVKQACEQGLTFGAPTKKEYEIASLIHDMMPSMEMMRMVNSGTEAVMSAIRVARGYTGKDYIVKFKGCYHGHSDGLLVKAGSAALLQAVPDSAGVPKGYTETTLIAEYNKPESVKALFEKYGDNIAAVIVEPVAANMGVVCPEEGFLPFLREITKKYQSLLIFDEVITGFRLAKGGAQEYYGVTPDLTTLGKIIGGGMPVGAYGGRKEIMSCVAPLGEVYQAGTLSGNPIAMTAGIETLKILRDSDTIYETIEKKAEKLAAVMRETFGGTVCVNQVGSLMSLFFTGEKVVDYDTVQTSDTNRYSAYFKAMLKEGIYLAPSQFEAMFVSAAVYAKRAMLDVVVIEKAGFSGGQIVTTERVDNYLGLYGESGYSLAMKFREHADALSVPFIDAEVSSVENESEYKKVHLEDGETICTKNVLVATGAGHKKLSVKGEEELTGAGVSYCATCDGAFFKNKTTAVVGGGDVALEDALYLANLCEKVYLIHRREGLRAAKELSEKVMAAENIEFLPYYEVKEIAGDGMAQKVILTQNQTGEEKEIELSGIFIAVGMEPQTAFVKDVVERNDAGYICAGEDCRTNVPGIYVAGDVRTKPLRQVITAVSDGAVAIASLEQDRN